MKKAIKILLIINIVCLALAAVTACGDNSLSAPQKTAISETNVLSWAKVEDAKSYTILVTDPVSGETVGEYTTRKTN